MRDSRERLQDILEAIAAIERYRDRAKAAFASDELLQTWFLRHLQIIGEAARALPDDVRRMAPDIPWTNIIGMRNILVHGYFAIDTEIVWEAATRDLPAMKWTTQMAADQDHLRPQPAGARASFGGAPAPSRARHLAMPLCGNTPYAMRFRHT